MILSAGYYFYWTFDNMYPAQNPTSTSPLVSREQCIMTSTCLPFTGKCRYFENLNSRCFDLCFVAVLICHYFENTENVAILIISQTYMYILWWWLCLYWCMSVHWYITFDINICLFNLINLISLHSSYQFSIHWKLFQI